MCFLLCSFPESIYKYFRIIFLCLWCVLRSLASTQPSYTLEYVVCHTYFFSAFIYFYTWCDFFHLFRVFFFIIHSVYGSNDAHPKLEKSTENKERKESRRKKNVMIQYYECDLRSTRLLSASKRVPLNFFNWLLLQELTSQSTTAYHCLTSLSISFSIFHLALSTTESGCELNRDSECNERALQKGCSNYGKVHTKKEREKATHSRKNEAHFVAYLISLEFFFFVWRFCTLKAKLTTPNTKC